MHREQRHQPVKGDYRAQGMDRTTEENEFCRTEIQVVPVDDNCLTSFPRCKTLMTLIRTSLTVLDLGQKVGCRVP